MLLKLLKYTYDVKYLPAKDMYTDDTLFRAFIKNAVEDEPKIY